MLMLYRRVFVDLVQSSKKNVVTRSSGTLEEKRTHLLRQRQLLAEAQTVYMPGVAALEAAWASDPKNENIPLEAAPVWLPSSMRAEARRVGCVGTLADVEQRFRHAQAIDALNVIRNSLRTKYGLLSKKKQAVGQRAGTRSRTLLDQINSKIQRQAATYRAARAALLSLDSTRAWQDTLRPLRDADLVPPSGIEDQVIDDPENPLTRRTEGQRSLSWIWISRKRTGANSEGSEMDEVDEEGEGER
jgi:hypothetical protein